MSSGTAEGDMPEGGGLQREAVVSIVIVAYNNWPDLELAIESALNQSYRRVEVIVVDNASTDETGRLVPEIYGTRVRYQRQPNTGEGGGRNTGIRLTQGGFVQFLDGDDCLAPNKVEKQMAMFRALPDADVVYGDVRQFQSGSGAATFEDCDTREYPDMLATLLAPDGNGAGLVTHGVLFRRTALQRVGPWHEHLPVSFGPVLTNMADQDFWLRTAWAGCHFYYCPGSLCFQRRRSGQLSADSRAVLRGMEQVYWRAREYIDREPYRSMVARRLGHLLFHLAIADSGPDKGESVAKLRQAREIAPEVVTRSAFLMARLLIVTGVGPYVFSPWLRPARKVAGLLAGMRTHTGQNTSPVK